MYGTLEEAREKRRGREEMGKRKVGFVEIGEAIVYHEHGLLVSHVIGYERHI